MAAFAQKLLSRCVDFLHVTVEAQADELAEIRIGMLPFERAEILLRLPVVFCGDFVEFRMTRTMEDIGGNRRLVEADMADQFIAQSDLDSAEVLLNEIIQRTPDSLYLFSYACAKNDKVKRR